MFGHWEKVYPVTLLLVEEWPEVCFDNLVDSFGLSIGLGLAGRRHVGANSCDGQEILLGIGCESGVTVGHDVSGKAVELPNFSGEYPGEISVGFLVSLQRYEVGHLRESVDN